MTKKISVEEQMRQFFEILDANINAQPAAVDRVDYESRLLKILMDNILITLQKYSFYLTDEAKEQVNSSEKKAMTKNAILVSLGEHFTHHQTYKNSPAESDKIQITRNQEIRQDLTNFFIDLNKNKKEITKRRDNGFKTFVKGLGVLGAAIFGFGVGGYFAHKHLFGQRATQGNYFIAECKKEIALRSKQLTSPAKSRPAPKSKGKSRTAHPNENWANPNLFEQMKREDARERANEDARERANEDTRERANEDGEKLERKPTKP